MKPFNLEEYRKNPSRKLVTRNGRKARIIYTDKLGKYPIGALIKDKNKECFHAYTLDGVFFATEEDDLDLFFAPEKKEGWINVYRDIDTGTTSFGAVLYASRKEAEEVGKSDDYYVATAKIEWKE